MIGEVCRFYGWTVEYVLRMPAPQFFVMLEALRTLTARERLQECKIQAIAVCDSKYYEGVTEDFLTQDAEYVKLKELEHQRMMQGYGVKKPGQIPAESEEARAAMFGIFTMAKGGG